MDFKSSSGRPTSGQGPRIASTAVEHSRLCKTDVAFVRLFLRSYDQYEREVIERVCQIVGQDVISPNVDKPIQMKFCMNPEWLESLTELDFHPVVASCDKPRDKQLQEYLSKKANESSDAVTMETLVHIVKNELHNDMAYNDARSRIQTLFVSVKSLLCIHRLHGSSMTMIGQLCTMYYRISALSSSVHALSQTHNCPIIIFQNTSKFSRIHFINLSEAFYLVNSGLPLRKY